MITGIVGSIPIGLEPFNERVCYYWGFIFVNAVAPNRGGHDVVEDREMLFDLIGLTGVEQVFDT
jgi:hypothetical protein